MVGLWRRPALHLRACLLRASATEPALCGIGTARAGAQALDLARGVQFAQMASVASCPEPGGLAGSGVVVIAAGALRYAGHRIIAGKGATTFAIGTVAARAIEASAQVIREAHAASR